MADDKRMDVIFGANLGGLTDGAAKATGIVKEATEAMTAQFEGLAAAADSLMAPFAAIGALLGGGALFKDAIEKTVDLGVELDRMGKITGMSAEELSRLKYAADLTHVPFEAVEKGLSKLSRSAYDAANGSKTQAQAFREMGISVLDSAGHLRPTQDLLLDVADALKSIHNPTQRQAEAMLLLGRSGAQMLPLLLEGAEGIKKLGEESDKAGATMSGKQVDAAVEYEDAMKQLHETIDGLWRSIGAAVVGPLTDLAQALQTLTVEANQASASSSNLGDSLEWIGTTFKLISQAVLDFEGELAEAMTEMEGLWHALGVAVTTYGKVQDLALNGHLSEAVAAAKQGFQDLRDVGIGTATAVAAGWDAVNEKIHHLYDGKAQQSRGEDGKKGGDTDLSGGGKQQSRLQRWQAQWERMKAIATSEGAALKDIDSDMEYAFWASKLAIARKYSDEWVKIQLKLAEIQQKTDNESASAAKTAEAAEKKRQDAQKKVNELIVADQMAASKQSIELERMKVEQLYSLGQINADQRYSQMQALDKKEQQLEMAELQRKLALAKGDAVQEQTVLNQISDMKRAMELKAAKDEDAALKASIQRYQQWGQQLGGIFAQVGHAILEQGQTPLQALGNAGKSVFGQLIDMGAQWVAKTIENAVIGQATNKASAVSEITANAGIAASAGMASVAAIPVVGWAMAPGVGASLLAQGLSYLASASASQGFDIPTGLNPITQLHQEEMVLPAHIANPMRKMLKSSGGAAIDTRGGGNTTLHIHAMDSLDVERTLRSHPAALASGIKWSARNGHLRRGMR
jgi:hypothetical protein